MRKRLVLVMFIAAIAVLAFVVLNNRYGETVQRQITASRVVIPQSQTELSSSSARTSIMRGDTVVESLIPLKEDESILNIVDLDFDGDGYDDQINAVKAAGSPYIQLLVGMYDPESRQYGRSIELPTKISQVKTFSYTGIDLIGDHSLALVYQGFGQNGNAVFEAYLIKKQDGAYSLSQIADIEGEGTIYIEQEGRGESYEHSLAKGQSYPVWMYSSDRSRPESSDQIQTCWEWDASRQKYVQTRKLHIAGSNLAAKDLASIQNGTVETFSAFLDGLWYKLNATTGEYRYLFFNASEQQIIFLLDDDAEVYSWENNVLQYRSMQIASTNLEIETLRRKLNVSLLELDKIRVLIQDDVQMLISEENVWNGEYKKMKFSDLYVEQNEEDALSPPYIVNLEEGAPWLAGDGTRIDFSGGTYTVQGGIAADTGNYLALHINNQPLVQFRSETDSPFFNGTYLVTTLSSTDGEMPLDKERVILQPYVVRADEIYPAEGRPLILTRNG